MVSYACNESLTTFNNFSLTTFTTKTYLFYSNFLMMMSVSLNIFSKNILSKVRKKKEENIQNKILSESYEEFFERKSEEAIEEYWLNKPFAKAVIYCKKMPKYELLEPKLTFKEFQALESVYRILRDRIILKDVRELEKKKKHLFSEFIEALEKLKENFNYQSIGKIWYYLSRDFIGYGKIDALLRDRYLEDISCSGYNTPVYVYHKVYGNMPTNVTFSESEMDNFVLKLSQKANVQISIEKPLADSTLPTGERIQLTYRNVISAKGPSFSIRRFGEFVITPVDLIAWKSVSPEVMAFLWLCVECRKNCIIVGATASGKTTMLNAIALFIPPATKIVSIEDTREIKLPHENWLPLITDTESMFEMLKATLRQRPEYILVGEIRGKEAITLFQAMNTGHTTYSTLHAGDVSSAINRLIHEPINVPVSIFDSLDIIVLLSIDYSEGKAVRKLQAIYDIYLDESNKIVYNPVFLREKKKFDYEWYSSQLMEEFAKQFGMTHKDVRNELKNRAKFLSEIERCNAEEFVKKVNDYRVEFYENL